MRKENLEEIKEAFERIAMRENKFSGFGKIFYLIISHIIGKRDETSSAIEVFMEECFRDNKECERILAYRWGLWWGWGTHTYKETGVEFGISRERVRQMEKKAIEKMLEKIKQL